MAMSCSEQMKEAIKSVLNEYMRAGIDYRKARNMVDNAFDIAMTELEEERSQEAVYTDLFQALENDLQVAAIGTITDVVEDFYHCSSLADHIIDRGVDGLAGDFAKLAKKISAYVYD